MKLIHHSYTRIRVGIVVLSAICDGCASCAAEVQIADARAASNFIRMLFLIVRRMGVAIA